MNADLVLALCSIVFSVSQGKQILFTFRNKLCGMSIISLCLFSLTVWTMTLTYWSIGLVRSSVFMAVSASLWSVMLWQRWHYGG